MILGWISAIAFTLCAIPQAITTAKRKSAADFSWLFLLLWLLGEIALIGYGIQLKELPLITNAVLNIFPILLILYYKVRE